MGDIKSAREISMGENRRIGRAYRSRTVEWKYLPEGEKLAARYLKGDVKNYRKNWRNYDKSAVTYITRVSVRS
jgi:hypothetical protein